MREKPKPQELYRHFKGKLYQIITIARHSETDEEMVVYQALYGDFRVYCRELSMFLSEVDHEKYPDADARYRLSRVEAQPAQNAQTTSAQAESRRETPPYDSPREEFSAGRSGSYHPTGIMAKTIEEEAEELHLDPRVGAFLDADSASRRLQVLEELRGSVTNDMIDIMAVAAGVDIEAGEPWERYNELRDCLRTIESFEADRLRK